MKKVILRFYAELNDFLPAAKRQTDFEYFFNGVITAKEAIESSGVPHSAVDLLLINGEPAAFSAKLNQNDRISVFPEFEMLDISGVTQLRKKPLRNTRFMADAHLGKLARNLRMLGFDTLFAGDLPDREIIETAAREKRTILTRDRDLLKSDRVDHGYYVRATATGEQLSEIIAKFDLGSQFQPFTRCLVCNGVLEEAGSQEIAGKVKPELVELFKACTSECFKSARSSEPTQ